MCEQKWHYRAAVCLKIYEMKTRIRAKFIFEVSARLDWTQDVAEYPECMEREERSLFIPCNASRWREWTRFVSKTLKKISKTLIAVAHTHGMMVKYCRALRRPTAWPCSVCSRAKADNYLLRPEFVCTRLGVLHWQHRIAKRNYIYYDETIRSRVRLPCLLWIGTNCSLCSWYVQTR